MVVSVSCGLLITIITNPRTHKYSVVHNATLCCCCYCCTEIYGNGKIGQKNYRVFAQRQDCETNHQEEFWNNVDLQKVEKQLYELILSFYLSGKYPYHCQSWTKVLEGSNQAPQGSQSQYVYHPVQVSNQASRALQSQDVNYPVQGSNRTAGTMNMNVWNRIQSTPIFAVFFGCFSRHRPVTRNKGSYKQIQPFINRILFGLS